jgi:hypothetical protein
MTLPRRLLLAALAAAAILLPRPARSEFFSDFYFGAAFTHDTSVHTVDETTFPETSVTEETDIDPSFSFGARFGYWVDPAPWFGFAFDFSYFQAEGGPIDENYIYPFSFLFMFRAPISRSPEFPYGRFQPYAAVGPAVFFSDAEVDLSPPQSGEVSESAADIGLDARAGFAWLFVPNIAMFIEYRFTYFRQDIEDDIDFINAELTSAQSLSSHHLLVGFSFRF